MAVTQRKFTYDELCAMPDDGILYELLDGELVTRASPTFRHQQVVIRLAWLFAPVEEGGHGVVVAGPFDVVFDQHNLTLPDFLFVGTARRAIVADIGCHGAPDLVVEILSPTSVERDWEAKFSTYERFGVRSYWIIDLGGQRVHRFDLVEGGYVERPALQPGDVLTSPLFPGVSLDVARLFPGEPSRERPATLPRVAEIPEPALDPPLPVDPAEVARLEDWHRHRQPARGPEGEDAHGR